MTCSVEGCARQSTKLGLCNAHYLRRRRHGDPLGGRTPTGEPERFLRGVVLKHAGEECIVWPFSRNTNGYGMIYLPERQASGLVSRIVCAEMHGNPPTPRHEAAHTCGNGHLGCCNPHHLVWKTRRENMGDTIVHGTSARGERNQQARLTEADVLKIRMMRGRKHSEIAKMFSVSRSRISMVLSGQAWGWL